MATALYRRYRPETFAEVIGQDHVTTPLRRALNAGRVGHAYLFSGPRGCGKTTSARILARCLNCAQGPTDTPCGECDSCRDLARGGPGSLDVVEIDAASHGGVEDARELRERATFAPARDRYKVFIIDEAHMVTSAGFNALLKLVEEPPEHVKFVFATTEPDKVIGTIRSRTHHYPFRLIPPQVLGPYLQEVCDAEGVQVGGGVLPLVVRAGGGSARDSMSVLDQLMAGAGEDGLDHATAIALLGFTDTALLDRAVVAIAQRDAAALYEVIEQVLATGHEPRRFVEDLLERLRDLIILAAVPERAAELLPQVPAEDLEHMREQSGMMPPADLSLCGDLVHETLSTMSGATSPRLHLELLAARLVLRDERMAGAPAGAPASGGAEGQAPRGAAQRGPAGAASGAATGPAGPQAGGAGGAAGGAPGSAREEARRIAAEKAEAARRARAESADGGRRAAPDARAEQHATLSQNEPTAPAAPAAREADPRGADPRGAELRGAEPRGDEARAGAHGPAERIPAEHGPAEHGPADHGPASGERPRPGDAGASGPGAEEVRGHWSAILDALMEIRRPMWALVSQNAQVVDMRGNVLVLGFRTEGLVTAFHRGTAAQNVAEAVRRIMRIDVTVEAVVGDGPGDGPAGGPGRGPDGGPGRGPDGGAGRGPSGGPGSGAGQEPRASRTQPPAGAGTADRPGGGPSSDRGWRGGSQGAPTDRSAAPRTGPAAARGWAPEPDFAPEPDDDFPPEPDDYGPPPEEDLRSAAPAAAPAAAPHPAPSPQPQAQSQPQSGTAPEAQRGPSPASAHEGPSEPAGADSGEAADGAPLEVEDEGRDSLPEGEPRTFGQAALRRAIAEGRVVRSRPAAQADAADGVVPGGVARSAEASGADASGGAFSRSAGASSAPEPSAEASASAPVPAQSMETSQPPQRSGWGAPAPERRDGEGSAPAAERAPAAPHRSGADLAREAAHASLAAQRQRRPGSRGTGAAASAPSPVEEDPTGGASRDDADADYTARTGREVIEAVLGGRVLEVIDETGR